MSERLYNKFISKGNPEKADHTYRAICESLQSHGYGVREMVLDGSQLPVSTRDADRRLLIPPYTISKVALLKDLQACEALGLDAKNKDGNLLGKRQVFSSFKELARDYNRFWSSVNPVMRRMDRTDTLQQFTFGLTFLTAKFTQLDAANLPTFLQGRIADVAAPMFLAAFINGISRYGRMRWYRVNIDSVSKHPEEIIQKDSQAFNKNILLALGACFVAEAGQLFHIYPGVFDPGDFVAYTVGAGLYYALRSPFERFATRQMLENLRKPLIKA